MTHRRSILLPTAVVVPLAALAIAGCGGSDNSGYSPPAASAKPAMSQRGGATVAVRSTSLGKILTDSQGRTLYLFEKDKGPKSTCSGGCASAWPPLVTSGKPKAGAGVTASKLGTTTRSDGSSEVTYNGHPLYTYAGDGAPGDTNGQGLDQFGAEWYVVSPAGHKVEGNAS
jgi:predicted lipoprotein with Yx(FWY)xxD motif